MSPVIELGDLSSDRPQMSRRDDNNRQSRRNDAEGEVWCGGGGELRGPDVNCYEFYRILPSQRSNYFIVGILSDFHDLDFQNNLFFAISAFVTTLNTARWAWHLMKWIVSIIFLTLKRFTFFFRVCLTLQIMFTYLLIVSNHDYCISIKHTLSTFTNKRATRNGVNHFCNPLKHTQEMSMIK